MDGKNEMDAMMTIDKNRTQYKFPSKEYRSVMKKQKDNFIYKLELNTCKFYNLKSVKYLKKNMSILSKNKFEVYKEYTNCLLGKDIKSFLDLRNKLECCDKFIEEIDSNLSNLDVETSDLKAKYNWHDIEIQFTTNKKRDEYVNGTYKMTDRKYNNQLISKINQVENRIKLLKQVIKKDNTRLEKILQKIKSVDAAVTKLRHFLDENFVVSSYVDKITYETEFLYEYYNKLMNNNKGELCDLAVYIDIVDEVKTSKAVKSARSELVEILQEYLTPKNEYNNVLLLPEFYDIAYDYIKYPVSGEKIEMLLDEMKI